MLYNATCVSKPFVELIMYKWFVELMLYKWLLIKISIGWATLSIPDNQYFFGRLHHGLTSCWWGDMHSMNAEIVQIISMFNRFEISNLTHCKMNLTVLLNATVNIRFCIVLQKPCYEKACTTPPLLLEIIFQGLVFIHCMGVWKEIQVSPGIRAASCCNTDELTARARFACQPCWLRTVTACSATRFDPADWRKLT